MPGIVPFSRVGAKWRWLAKLVFGLFYAFVAVDVTLKILVVAMKDSADYPTATVMQQIKEMPNLVLKTNGGWKGCRTWTSIGNFEREFSPEHPYCPACVVDGDVIKFNASCLKFPDVSTAGSHDDYGLFVTGTAHRWDNTSTIELFAGDAPPVSDVGTLTSAKFDQLFQIGFQVFHSEYNVQCFEIEKEFTPDNGIPWGFRSGAHPRYSATWHGSYDVFFIPQSEIAFEIKVLKTTVATTTRIGIFGQLYPVLVSIGGAFSLAMAIFTSLFVREFPLSAEEKKKEQLTLRGNEILHPLHEKLLHEVKPIISG